MKEKNHLLKRPSIRAVCLLSVLIGSVSIGIAQNESTDSIWSVWEDESKHDTVRLEALRAAIWERYFFIDPDSAFYYAQILHDGAETADMKQLMAEAVNIQAGTFYIKGEIENAIPYAERYVEFYEMNFPNSRNLSTALINVGSLYSELGDKVKAIQCFERSLKVAKEHEYFDVQAGSLMNLGNEYDLLDDQEAAIGYLERSIELYEKLGDLGKLGTALANLGVANKNLGDYDRALEYVLQAVDAHEQLEDPFYISSSLILLSQVYMEMGKYEESQEQVDRAYELSSQFNLKKILIGAYIQMGELNLRQNDLNLADQNCKASLNLARELAHLEHEFAACECLYHVNKTRGQHQEALFYLELKSNLQDSLNITETAKKLQRMEFDKELLADSLQQEEEKHAIELAHQEEVAEKDKTRNLLMGGGLLLLLVAGGLFSRNRYVNRSKKQIQKEKDRSEELLLNILPEEVAEELKDKGQAEAQLIDHVTVLFTDFKGFTALSEKLSPKELVDDLNVCFSEFDRITAKYGIEKIKTIGDAYMAAGGLPTPNDTHATDVIKAALEMRDFVEAGKAKKIEQGLPYFEVRVGVHTGPVVAGIVGVKKFQYDIWGDTVNTASRMESSGEVGQVNISEATYEMVKDNSKLSFTSRGKVKAKGKGELEMYFVEQS